MRGACVLAALVVASTASLLAPGRALAQARDRDERRREQTLEKLAKKLAVPQADLAAAGGERYAAREAATRKAFLGDLALTPRPTLVPVIVDAALNDPDHENRRAAIALFSIVGLEADRALFLDS